MFRSLFLFDVTFWLYLAGVGLYFSYLMASRTMLQPAAAGHPTVPDNDSWAEPLGQLATWVTFFGLLVNAAAPTVFAGDRGPLGLGAARVAFGGLRGGVARHGVDVALVRAQAGAGAGAHPTGPERQVARPAHDRLSPFLGPGP